MDIDEFNAFAKEQRGQGRALDSLRESLVGRVVLDATGVLLAVVEDVLVSSREKIPQHLVIRLTRRRWQRIGDERLYPVEALGPPSDGHLVATHTTAAVRRLLDFRRDFLAATMAAQSVSLVEYLGAHGPER